MKCVDFVCSYAACCEFLQQNNLLSIIRAHEAQDAGYVHFGMSFFLHLSRRTSRLLGPFCWCCRRAMARPFQTHRFNRPPAYDWTRSGCFEARCFQSRLCVCGCVGRKAANGTEHATGFPVRVIAFIDWTLMPSSFLSPRQGIGCIEKVKRPAFLLW